MKDERNSTSDNYLVFAIQIGEGRQRPDSDTIEWIQHVPFDIQKNVCKYLSDAVCWLSNVPAIGYWISGTDLLRHFYVLSH